MGRKGKKGWGGNGALACAMAVLATMVGGGFASGREVVSFFSRFGAWGWIGVAAASAAIALIGYGMMTLAAKCGQCSFHLLCTSVLGRFGGHAFSMLFLLLSLVTGGAMASGIGEILAVFIPIPHMVTVGLIAGASLCAWGAWRGVGALAKGGGFLLPLCLAMYVLIARNVPVEPAVYAVKPAPAWLALPLGLCYAFLNASLSCGLLTEIGSDNRENQTAFFRRAALLLGLSMAALLGAANAVFLPRAAGLLDAALPMVLLTRALGPAGMLLTAFLLVLAMGTTLTALLRSIASYVVCIPRIPCMPQWAAILLAGALVCVLGSVGFSSLVGVAYPVMGWLGAVLLVALLIKGKTAGKT